MKALESVNTVLERWKCYWESFPEDRIELRTSWDTMDEIATDFYYSLLTVQDELATPAPIDWAKEFDHMIALRQKAIQYITEAVSTCITIYLGEDGVASFDPDHGGWGGQEGVLATVMHNRYKQVILCDRYEESGDTDYEYTLDSLETSQLIEVAARVSQAIASK